MENDKRTTANVPQNLVTPDSEAAQRNPRGKIAEAAPEVGLFTGRPAGANIESRPASLDSVVPSEVG